MAYTMKLMCFVLLAKWVMLAMLVSGLPCDNSPSKEPPYKGHGSNHGPHSKPPFVPTPTTPSSKPPPLTRPPSSSAPGSGGSGSTPRSGGSPSNPGGGSPVIPGSGSPTTPGSGGSPLIPGIGSPLIPGLGSPTTPGSGTPGTIPGAGGATTCPVDIAQLNVCAPVLGGLLGNPLQSNCCALLGLVGLNVEVCLCAAIDANVLGLITIHARLSVIATILTTCGQTIPPNLSCPP